jgi:nitrite reductase/ring-hydroxylating ferredoxin subunit
LISQRPDLVVVYLGMLVEVLQPLEKEAVVAEFVTIGKVSDVPGGGLAAFEVAGRRVAVANVAGTYYAFDNTCTHLHCALAEGDLDGTTVTCPCHGSQFDVTTGQVVNPPALEPVASYPLRVERNEIQVEV